MKSYRIEGSELADLERRVIPIQSRAWIRPISDHLVADSTDSSLFPDQKLLCRLSSGEHCTHNSVVRLCGRPGFNSRLHPSSPQYSIYPNFTSLASIQQLPRLHPSSPITASYPDYTFLALSTASTYTSLKTPVPVHHLPDQPIYPDY